MQKLTIVLLFALLALATATPMKFKKLTPANPEPQCSLLEIAACADEIGGRMRKLYNFVFLLKNCKIIGNVVVGLESSCISILKPSPRQPSCLPLIRRP
jgi:hypothetical protein